MMRKGLYFLIQPFIYSPNSIAFKLLDIGTFTPSTTLYSSTLRETLAELLLLFFTAASAFLESNDFEDPLASWAVFPNPETAPSDNPLPPATSCLVNSYVGAVVLLPLVFNFGSNFISTGSPVTGETDSLNLSKAAVTSSFNGVVSVDIFWELPKLFV